MRKVVDPVALAQRAFLVLAVVLLIGTALLKIVACAVNPRVWEPVDPVLGLSQGTTMTFAALLELAVASGLVLNAPRSSKGLLLLWLCTSFTVYRVLEALASAPARGCPCLGVLPNITGMSARHANALSLAILVFLALGGVVLLLASRGGRPQPLGLATPSAGE